MFKKQVGKMQLYFYGKSTSFCENNNINIQKKEKL